MSLFQVVLIVLYHRRLQFHGEILADVEAGQFSIYVCIDNGQGIHSDKDEHTHVAVSTVVILFAFDDTFQVIDIGVYRIPWRQQIHEAVGVGVVVHDVQIGL